MIAVSRSIRIDQSVLRLPDSMNRRICIVSVVPSKVRNTIQLSSAERNRPPVAIQHAASSPSTFQPKPQMRDPISGAKRSVSSMSSALHHVDIFHGDGAAVSEETDQNGQTNGSLSRRNRQDE